MVNLWLSPSVHFYVPCFRYKAVYNYKPQNSDELELREGDIVQVMEKCDDGWFVGEDFYFETSTNVIFSVCAGNCEGHNKQHSDVGHFFFTPKSSIGFM